MVIGFGLAAGGQSISTGGPSVRPAFQVDCPFPTSDKPQSKLWFAEDHWWALLPRATGPSLWERTATGWREHPKVAEVLRGVPGRADVWYDADGVTAVAVADRQLAVVRLTGTGGSAPTWQAEVLARIPSPVSDIIETVTLSRDSRGRWWVAAPIQGRVFTWNSRNGLDWSKPLPLVAGLHVDDLCLITRVPEGVAVVWSDQKRDAVKIRLHRDVSEEGDWELPVTVESGGKTADDHLHATLAADGRLWVATKNSVDQSDQPQLVLRVRGTEGQWRNFPYAPLTPNAAPSRPITVGTPDANLVLLGHVVYGPRGTKGNRIVFGRVDLRSPAVIAGARVVIAPEDPASQINDIAGPKAPFPAGRPWIVLASDGEGRVYEADLNTGAP